MIATIILSVLIFGSAGYIIYNRVVNKSGGCDCDGCDCGIKKPESK